MSLGRPIAAIAAKDIVQRFRDRSEYIMGVIGPLAPVFIMSATIGAADDVSAFESAVADGDGGEGGDGQRVGELAAAAVALEAPIGVVPVGLAQG